MAIEIQTTDGTTLLSTWMTSTSLAFVAGILVALSISAIISKWPMVVETLKRYLRPAEKIQHDGLVIAMPENERKAMTKRQIEKSKAKTPPKPFEFRPRLWNEPPELDYREYECHDEFQKKLRTMGDSAYLQWGTTWLDNLGEGDLIMDYRKWIREGPLMDESLPEKEKEFYRNLMLDLWIEWEESGVEFDQNNERYGATKKDLYDIDLKLRYFKHGYLTGERFDPDLDSEEFNYYTAAKYRGWPP